MAAVVVSSTELAEALSRVCRVVVHLVESYDEDREPDKLDLLVFQVDRLFRMLLSLDVSDQILEAISASFCLLQEVNESLHSASTECGYTPHTFASGTVGRPRFNITQEQLEHLLSLGFSGPRIAEVLGVSLSTVRRRMNDYNLCIRSLYSVVTDEDLDRIVSDIKQEFPNCGYRLMKGHLLHRGYRVTQARIRESLHRVDPEGITIRWSSVIYRRKYAVRSPLSLWHIDGNHKLIRCVCFNPHSQKGHVANYPLLYSDLLNTVCSLLHAVMAKVSCS